MKRIITLLLLAALALGLLGCSLPGAKKPEEKPADEGDINVIHLIRNVEAIDFPADHEFADKRITRFQLAQALQAAAEKKLPAADGEAAGLALGQDGYWSRTYHLDAKTGASGELWLELTCGLTENVVRIIAYQGAQYGLCYVDAPDLYQLLRHYRDRETVISEQAYERYGEIVGAAIQEIYQDQVDNGQPFTGWELTRLEYLRSYTDDTDDSTVNIYAVEYVMLTDHPEKVQWKEGMALDSRARVENVGDLGRLATRYWWWGEKWETALLSKTVPADELKEAREALNENNPRN